jgi:hypothetical protein
MQNTATLGIATETPVSASVKVQNIIYRRNYMTCSPKRNYRTTATLYTKSEPGFSGTLLKIPCINCLRHCATNRKAAGSIPDSVVGIVCRHNPSGRTMTLRSTQPLTEMSTRNISSSKIGQCGGLTTLQPSCADCVRNLEPQLPETLKACNGIASPLT